MNRYLYSFFITYFIYSCLIFTYLTSLKSPPDPSPIAKQKEIVKFKVITQVKAKKIEKKMVKIIEPKIIEAKKIEKKKPKSKPKKIKKIKPKVVKKREEKTKKLTQRKIEENLPIIKPKKMEEEIIKEVVQEIIKEPIPPLEEKVVIPQIDKKELEEKQNLYHEKIKQIIKKNKSYPKRAVRREIEGTVKIKFTISPQGKLISFDIIEGQKIFHKSITQAVQDSFPLTPPKDIFKKNIDLTLAIEYRLF